MLCTVNHILIFLVKGVLVNGVSALGGILNFAIHAQPLARAVIYPYLAVMRSLALMAFLALQLSVFTCGFDIHVHAAGIDEGHVAEHTHDSNADHEQESHDHGCHVHASHSFTMADEKQIDSISVVSTPQHFAMAGTYLKNLPSLIEHPPKLQYC
ncbi:hypothetical protein MMIC_P1618 [Mariprofundus micogutta]|uniref:Uncharacterized protein n=2 Tax=Mariprofundus micogutta TaxID=1921010 RepID=A0A1L8CP01_9PROT|nr:hypothetical protein MMIC_P1618 [Mariprofundus micogutta]